ncbi:MAG TPA: 50S ribosomal protein L11 methyltransferase [Gammaproteobacteria bacterium]|nr:50S ribosomal protein L11 methyltransferase [Gammaproteobacteria bacterium]
MAWNQLTLYASRAIAEQLSTSLEDLGAVSVTLKEGGAEEILEPLPGETPLWRDTQVVGLFDQAQDIHRLVETLKQIAGVASFPRYTIEAIADQDWERAWLKDFKPMRFGRNLWIVPSSHAPLDEHAVNIMLDPGLAFGTGTHATTALCLQWLDANNVCDQVVIDYGCGSGVLAIAAAKLGAKKVYAVDIDPQAITATQQNALNNAVHGLIDACLVDTFEEKLADVLLANILANPLETLASSFATLLRPSADIVLSGILETQADAVLQVYSQWFDMNPVQRQAGWALLSGKKKVTTQGV